MRPQQFILASTSPRRKEFMQALGIPFKIIAPGASNGATEIDETPLPDESPANLVQRLSHEKAQAVVDMLPHKPPHAIIIAADTAVVFEDNLLGKPVNPAEAVIMLKQLRHRPHFVYSGLTTAHPASGRVITRLHQSKVWMRPYTDTEIEAYVATGSPLDKAGAYGIQDGQFAPVERMEGCYASVMGFPLGELAAALHQLGYTLPEIGPICSRHTGAACCTLSAG